MSQYIRQAIHFVLVRLARRVFNNHSKHGKDSKAKRQSQSSNVAPCH